MARKKSHHEPLTIRDDETTNWCESGLIVPMSAMVRLRQHRQIAVNVPYSNAVSVECGDEIDVGDMRDAFSTFGWSMACRVGAVTSPDMSGNVAITLIAS